MKMLDIGNSRDEKLVLTESDVKNGVIICFEQGYAGGNVAIEVVADESIINPKGTPIKGHPNCVMGECYDCHVVSCAIHQGFEEAEPEEN